MPRIPMAENDIKDVKTSLSPRLVCKDAGDDGAQPATRRTQRQEFLSTEGDLGGGNVGISVYGEDEDSYLMVEGARGTSPVKFRIPSILYKKMELKDVDSDGDLDVVLDTDRKPVIYQNLSGNSPKDHAVAEMAAARTLANALERMIRETKIGDSRRILTKEEGYVVRSTFSTLGPEKYAKIFVKEAMSRCYSPKGCKDAEENKEDVLKEMMVKEIKVHSFQNVVQARLMDSSSLEERATFLAEIIKILYQGANSESQQMAAYFLLHGISGEFLVPVYLRLDPIKFAGAICPIISEAKYKRDIVLKNIMDLHERNPELAAAFSERLVCEGANYEVASRPDYAGLMEFTLRVDSDVVARYLNFLFRHHKDKALNLISEVKQKSPAFIPSLSKNGLNKNVVEEAGFLKQTLEEFSAGLARRDLKGFEHISSDMFSELVDSNNWSAEDLAYLFEFYRKRGGILSFIGSKLASKINEKIFGQALEIICKKDASLAREILDFMIMQTDLKTARVDEMFPEKTRFPSDIGRITSALTDLSVGALGELLSLSDVADANLEVDLVIRYKELYQAKIGILSYLEYARPEIFDELSKRVQGPYVFPGMSVDVVVEKLNELYRARQPLFIMEILDSSLFSQETLFAILDRLPFASDSLFSNSENLVVRHRQKEKLFKTNPGLALRLLGKRIKSMDDSTREEVLGDLLLLTDDEFARLVREFHTYWEEKPDDFNSFGSFTHYFDEGSTLDNTGLGVIYDFLKKRGDARRIEILKQNSGHYFDYVDLLRDKYGIDVNLYTHGKFGEPFKPDEIQYIADAMKRMPSSAIKKLKGITIADRWLAEEFDIQTGKRSAILGVHDSFGNIVLFRNFNPKFSLRIPTISFIDELVTHEAAHSIHYRMDVKTFDLFARAAGYMKNNIYRDEYKLVATREMTSGYFMTIFEEFAEFATHYQKNGDELRQRAWRLFEKGDPYLMLQYLFFKYLPPETRGREFVGTKEVAANSPEVPLAETVTFENVRARAIHLGNTGAIDAAKLKFILARLREIESAK